MGGDGRRRCSPEMARVDSIDESCDEAGVIAGSGDEIRRCHGWHGWMPGAGGSVE
jgi:hypothetical protein